MIRLPIILVLLAFVLAACAETPAPNQDDPVQPTITPIPPPPVAERPTVTVERGDVVDLLAFTAQWLPRDQQELSFPINGTVRSVNVRRGDSVSEGDLLADYQIQDLEDRLDSARITLETALLNLESGAEGSVDAVLNAQFGLADANNNLESTLNNAPWTSLESARINLADAQRNLDNAIRSYEAVIGDPTSPSSAVDSAYNQVESAESQLRSAQNNYYSAAQSYNQHEYQIDNARNNQLRAEIELQNAITGAGVDPQQVQNVRSAELDIAQIEEQIAQSSLFAPFDGIVLEVTIQPGAQVQAFTGVITLALPQPSEAIATLSFNDVQQLDIGKLGECQVANRPETRVECVVRSRPFTSQEADQTVRVAADFAEPLQLGQLVEVDMPLQTREDVLYLPPRAIRTFQNRTFVIVQRPDGEAVVDIEVGLQTDDRVEILSGLEEGDVVVLP
jgi:RND family efflux transporter MFP subunit